MGLDFNQKDAHKGDRMSKHTERSLKYMRSLGYTCDMVERFIAFPKPHGHRVDFLNIIDFIGIDEFVTVGVQSCGSSFSAHKQKLYEHPNSNLWLANASRQLWLIGWSKRKIKRGGVAYKYMPRIEIIQPGDL